MKNQSIKTQLFIGIDVAKNSFDICFMHENGKILDTFKIKPTKRGFDELRARIDNDKHDVTIGLENTGPWSENFVQYFKKFNFHIVLGHAKNIVNLRKILSKSVKNDTLDAQVISIALRMNLLKDSKRDEKHLLLHELLERYHDLKGRTVALTNQLRAGLVQTFPEISQLFKNINSKSSLAILSQYQSSNDFSEVEVKMIRPLIKESGGSMSNKKIELLINQCKKSVAWKNSEYSKYVIKSIVEELTFLKEKLNFIQQQIREYVTSQFSREAELIQSVPGIGEITSYQFLATIGDHKRFDPDNDGKGAKRVSSYFGYGIREYSSGYRTVKTGIDKQGNTRVRGLMFMVAMNAIRFDKDLNEKYQAYKERGNGKKALVSISHTLIRRCYGVLRSGKRYNPKIPLIQTSSQ